MQIFVYFRGKITMKTNRSVHQVVQCGTMCAQGYIFHLGEYMYMFFKLFLTFFFIFLG